jgi:hypothetical protein
MSLLKKSGYQSEFTQFINELKLKDPKIEEGQRTGRARLWDLPPTDLDTQERLKASRVSQKAYPYQNK